MCFSNNIKQIQQESPTFLGPVFVKLSTGRHTAEEKNGINSEEWKFMLCC